MPTDRPEKYGGFIVDFPALSSTAPPRHTHTPGFVKQGKKKGARCCPSIGKRPTVLVSLPQVAEVGRENPLGAEGWGQL